MSILPSGWIVREVQEIFDSFSGGTPAKDVPAYWNGDLSWLSSGDIKKYRIGSGVEFITIAGLQNSSAKLCRRGSVLVVVRSGVLKHTLPVAILENEAAINQDIKCFDSSSNDLNIWLALSLRAFAKEILAHNREGTTVQSVKYDTLKRFELSIPPLNEQRRIVAKLEELLGKVEACQKRLERIPLILKRFRQSVLAAACSGRLTEDWRKRNTETETHEGRKEDLVEQRQQRYMELCAKARESGSAKPRPFSRSDEPMEDLDLPDIPVTWEWERLVNLAHIQGGVAKGRRFNGQRTVRLPYLRVANVQDGYLDLNEIKEIEALPEDSEKYRLEDGDILFTEGGDRDKLGRGTIWNNPIPGCIHQNHIFRARLYLKTISPSYISIVTKSDYARRFFFDKASQTVNLASINMTSLGRVPIALPPAEEQREIVLRVQALFTLADQLEARYQKAKAYVDKLTQSILAKAFRGELVPQDPNDEPASVLLERIRQERENTNGAQPKARKKKARSATK